MISPAQDAATSSLTAPRNVSFYSARLGRTLNLSRTARGVHVYLYAGHKTDGKPALVAALDPICDPSVDPGDDALQRRWLSCGFAFFELDDASEAHAVDIWLASTAQTAAELAA